MDLDDLVNAALLDDDEHDAIRGRSVRIVVTGASGVLGRGIVGRLLTLGHDVAGLARRRPESWPSAAEFVHGDVRDATAVRRAVTGADVVVALRHGPATAPSTTKSTSAAMPTSWTPWPEQHPPDRILFIRRTPSTRRPPKPAPNDCSPAPARNGSRSGRQLSWVATSTTGCCACWHRRCYPAATVQPSTNSKVVHSDDALRVLVRASTDTDTNIASGAVNLAAPGELSLGELAKALRRPVVRIPAALQGWSQVI
ncbi:NAD-dependent epimerase/dehydratase family protein, partial [Mycolicibacterium vaccae]|nr:NAD-dependent epimerase/dehydratase family protein [Mycolicibacterium vaccae]